MSNIIQIDDKIIKLDANIEMRMNITYNYGKRIKK